MVPRATYRLQLTPDFGFDAVAELAGYLARLGVSHAYLSPVLQAAAGSTHGYDVVDHGRLSAELGGEDAFARMTDALRAAGLGIVVDVVPNHMAIADGNAWWWDVLEHGPASRYADVFDVDWDPPEIRLRNVVLLPFLPDHYGRVLESGGIGVARDAGRLLVEVGERRLPLDPRSVGPPVERAAREAGLDELAFIGAALGDLPPSTDTDPAAIERRQRDAVVLGERLDALVADRRHADALDAAVRALNDDVDALDALLEEQNYRLAFWRASSRDLGYRRFFDINELIALRMEDPRVFRATHRRVIEWVAAGSVDGLRIDHPDGLRDPAGYFARLREAAPGAWIVAEKILEADEPLRPDWAVDGTTGYRFANLATGLLVDPAAEGPLTELYARFTGAEAEPAPVVAEARRQVLAEVLGSDVNRLTELFLAVCEANRRYRDFTRHELHETLREVAAEMPVYRTYVRARDRHVDDADRERVRHAVAAAAGLRADLDPELFALLERILLLEEPGPLAAELAMRFQQLTSAAMAKGVEDTAFYRYLRLTALNEVGGSPAVFGVDVATFHAAMADLHQAWPAGMLASSTHDTKRSEDVRARIAALSHDPAGWAALVDALAEAAAPHRSGEDLPSRADEYLLHQTLVGTWPISADRAWAYLEKASREAKLRTSWTSPDPEYDAALERLVRGAIGDPSFVAVLEAGIAPFVARGRDGALVQLALKLTAPGVPDLYQGTELWDDSLVDPDNRRPVDFALRDRLLGEASGARDAAADGRGATKLALLRGALDLRARRPEAFGPGDEGAYRPLATDGPGAETVVAFTRGASVALVAALRDRATAAGASVALPDGRWRDVRGGPEHPFDAPVGELLGDGPVAILERVT